MEQTDPRWQADGARERRGSRALAAAGQGTLAATFAIVALISGTLNYVWD